jgi:hypothetical protein
MTTFIALVVNIAGVRAPRVDASGLVVARTWSVAGVDRR